MKNLKRVRINEFVEMTDREMKFTVGGSGSDSGSGSTDTCPSGTTKCSCNGVSQGCKSKQDCCDLCGITTPC